jgi:hypothetical protein
LVTFCSTNILNFVDSNYPVFSEVGNGSEYLSDVPASLLAALVYGDSEIDRSHSAFP